MLLKALEHFVRGPKTNKEVRRKLQTASEQYDDFSAPWLKMDSMGFSK